MNEQVGIEGDTGFIGFASRLNPRRLPAGMLALSRNGRIEREQWQPRKGAQRLAEDIVLTNTPLTLPFDLAPDRSVTSLTRAVSTVTATCPAHGYTTGQQVNIRGAVENDYNGDYQITVTGTDTFTYTILTTPTTPATGTIFANRGPIVQNVYGGGILTSGIFKSPNFQANREWIVLVGTDAAYLYAQDQSTITRALPAGQTVTTDDETSVVQAFDRLFILRSRPIEGAYARKAVTSITQTTGTATVTTTAAHNLTSGMRVRLEGAGQAGYLHEYDITVTSPTVFTLAVPNATVTPATGTITARRVQPPLVWDGFAATTFVVSPGGVPAVGPTFNVLWSTHLATYFNNQLVTAPTPIRDTVQISKVLEYNIYDPLQQSFRANAGSDDTIVALHAFAERRILVFGRKTIYRADIVLDATGTTFDPAQSQLEMITNEIGCAARETVVTAGEFVYFLSDSGVYRLDSNYTDLKLRGVQVPLSDPIQDQFDTINYQTIGRSVARYHENRYYLAIPTGTATDPNTILIFNMLNQQWESVDTYTTEIHRLIVAPWNGRRRMFGSGRAGYLFLLEEREDGDQTPATTEITPIAAEMVTRRYEGSRYGRKRWLNMKTSAILPPNSTLQMSGIFRNPDLTVQAGTKSNPDPAEIEDYEIKRPLRTRAHEVDLRILTTAGRPTIRAILAEVVETPPPGDNSRDVS